jgi:anti-anti-sigma factor
MTELAHFQVARRGDICIGQLEGEIDISNAEAVEDALEGAMGNTDSGLILDLSNVTYVDSAGIRVLFRLATRLRTRRQRLRLAIPETAVVKVVLSVSGLDRVVPLSASVDDAIVHLSVPDSADGSPDGAPPRE